jgi:glycosyltransferase involved in cell wall biosynthesis
MKIVHVVPSLGRGGGERLVIEFANREAAAGHQVAVVASCRLSEALSHGGLSPEVDLRFLSEHELAGVNRYRPLLPWLWRQRDWLSGQDILHCHLTFGAVFATAFQILARLTGRRRPAIVETYHAVGMPIASLHRWFHARMAARRDALSFMVEEPYWREFMRRHPRLNAKIIPVGVSAPDLAGVGAQRSSALRAQAGIPAAGATVVGTIGRLVPERESHRYIPVFARIAREAGDGVHFFMGGDGPEAGRIRALIAEAGLEERIYLAGLVQEMEPVFSILDLYITSNVGSVPGVAGLQAIAAGLPTIAIQLVPAYRPSETDWIRSSSDPDEVAAWAVELIRSPEKRRELAERQGRYLEERHSPQAMAKSYEALYREAIASHGKP